MCGGYHAFELLAVDFHRYLLSMALAIFYPAIAPAKWPHGLSAKLSDRYNPKAFSFFVHGLRGGTGLLRIRLRIGYKHYFYTHV